MVQWRAEWVRTLRYRWEAINNAWNQNVLGYNPQRQRELLARLGLPDTDWRSLAIALGSACSLLVAVLMLWALYQRPERDPVIRLWHKALRHLARRKVDYQPWETPLELTRRIREQHPELAESFQHVVDAYLVARYSTDNSLTALRDAIAQLR